MNINIFKNNAFLGDKTPVIGSILAGILAGICLLGIVTPQTTNADFAGTKNASYVAKVSIEAKKVVKTLKVVATAYSSTPDQTDDTPFITASGSRVAENIIANNGLPFGTKVRIPELFGEKIFIVGDRMNKRFGNYRIDLWFPSRELAMNFGVRNAELEILED